MTLADRKQLDQAPVEKNKKFLVHSARQLGPPLESTTVPVTLPVAKIVAAPASPRQKPENANANLQSAKPVLPTAAPVLAAPALPVAMALPAIDQTLDPAKALQDIESESQEPATVGDRVRDVVAILPSWMVSFILHTILLVALGVFTLIPDKGPSTVDLELGEQATVTPDMIEFDTIMDVSVEDVLDEVDPAMMSEESDDTFEDLSMGIEEQFELTPLESLVGGKSLDMSLGESKFAPGEGARFFGTGAKGKTFVFVVDASSSMTDEYRWEIAISELKAALSGLTSDQKFVVFLYSSMTFYMERGKPELTKATEKHKEKVYNWLDEMSPRGDTRPWEAVSVALRLEPDAIFLLSDGELRDDTVRLLEKANDRLARRRSRDGHEIPVHTVFLGNGVGGPTMESIASQNSGTFKKVDNW